MRHVVSDPSFLNGKPCLSGVRLSLELILEEFIQKKNIRDIVRKYPQLIEDDVVFALQYAIRLINTHPEDAEPPRKPHHP